MACENYPDCAIILIWLPPRESESRKHPIGNSDLYFKCSHRRQTVEAFLKTSLPLGSGSYLPFQTHHTFTSPPTVATVARRWRHSLKLPYRLAAVATSRFPSSSQPASSARDRLIPTRCVSEGPLPTQLRPQRTGYILPISHHLA